MVGRAIPLVVDVLVAALAGIRFHKELAGNLFSAIHLRGTGEKRAGRAIAFAVHGERWQRGIHNAPMLVPATFAKIASGRGERRERYEHRGGAKNSMTGQPPSIADSGRSH